MTGLVDYSFLLFALTGMFFLGFAAGRSGGEDR